MYFRGLLSYPPEKGRSPSFEQTLILFNWVCLVPSLIKIGPVIMEKKDEIMKSLQTDKQADDGQQAIRKAQVSW